MKKIYYAIIMLILFNMIFFIPLDNVYAGGVITTLAKDRGIELYWGIPKYNTDDTQCFDLVGVYLFRSLNKDGPFTMVTPKLFPPTQRWWHDDQKVNGVTYYYRLKAIDDVGNASEYSDFAEATPLGDTSPPEAPFITVVINGNCVDVSWNPSYDDQGIDHYNIYRALTELKDEYMSRTRKGIPSLIQPLTNVDGEILNFSDCSAQAGTFFYYAVTAVDLSGNESKCSNVVVIKFPGVDTNVPIIESISENTNNRPQKIGKEINILVVGESKLITTYTLGSLALNQPMIETAKPGTYYAVYKVKSGDDGTAIPITVTMTDSAGNKIEKNCPTAITIDTLPPAEVKNLEVTTGFDTTIKSTKGIFNIISKVELSWTKNEEAEYYKIYRAENQINDQNIKQATIVAKRLVKDTIYYKDLTATPGKTFYYAVGSLDLAENIAIGQNAEIKVAADIYPPKIAKIIEDTYGVPQKAGNTIQVVLYGEPSCIASYDIGTKIVNMPMEEVLVGSIHTGTYSGKYVVKQDDDVDKVQIAGHLKDIFGNEAVLKTETEIGIKTRSTDTTPPEITKISHDRENYVLIEGEPIKVTLEGEPDCIAFFDIGVMKRGIKLYQTETKGIYEGIYVVQSGDNIGSANIIGYLSDDSGNVSTKNAENTITIDTSVKIVLSKEPSSVEYLPADSTSIVDIIASVTNAHDAPVEGRKIDFLLVSNFGTVTTLNGITDSHGNAKGRYQAGLVVQTAYISAEDVETGIAGITYIRTTKTAEVEITLQALQRRLRTSNGMMYIDMEAHPERITADGNSVSIITATIRKIGLTGVPGPKKSEETETNKNNDERIPGEKVYFNIVDGPPGAQGEIRIHPKYADSEAGVAVTDVNGEAKAIYTAGTRIGLVIINATAPLSIDKGGAVAEIIGVVLIAGEVRYLTITADPALLNADGQSRSTITVEALDSFKNPCENINVDIKVDPPIAEYGSIVGFEGSGKNVTTGKDGKATAEYVAGTIPAKITIKATVTSNTPIDDGVVSYDQKKYKEAIDFFKKAIADYPQDNWSDDVYYIMGNCEEIEKTYNDAINSYTEVVRYYFGGPWADNALYRVGQVYEKMADYPKAIDAYQELIDNAYLLESKEVYKNNLIDNALFRMAVMYERLEHYEMAKSTYQELIDRFKTTDEISLVDDAEKALEDLRAKGY